MPSKVTKAPFDHEGNLLHYPVVYTSGRAYPEWRPNIPFVATLTIYGMSRGRSAAYFIWQDEDEHEYPMFISDAVEVLRRCTISNGRVTARWIVKKRGQNFGIGLDKDGL